MNGAPTTVLRSSMKATIWSISSGAYPSLSSDIETVLFTIVISPPPTSFFDFTSEKSGSTPVVRVVPGLPRGREQVSRHDVGVLDVPDRGPVLGDDADHRARIRLVARE